MCLLEIGTLVEVKSCLVRKGDGERGRFYPREEQHRALVDDAGVYLFAVCEPRPERPLVEEWEIEQGDQIPFFVEEGEEIAEMRRPVKRDG